MGNLKDWEAFTLSGKVEDYLKYAANVKAEEQTKGQDADTYAGFAHSDRAHTESGTYRGI